MRAEKRGSTTQSACEGWLCQASGDRATTCLPSRLSRVRAPSPAPLFASSLCRPVRSRLAITRQRYGKQGDDVFMCQKACSDILPLPGCDILPRQTRHPAFFPRVASSHICLCSFHRHSFLLFTKCG